MASNVLPLFWNLASSSTDTRLAASADLISSLEGFQDAFVASLEERESSEDSEDDEDDDNDTEANGEAGDEVHRSDSSNEEEDDGDEDDEDAESGIEVDASDDEDMEDGEESDSAELDRLLAKENASDVVYTVKRLVRGLASSRESSRLGFAVALTELLSRITTISAAQVISLLIRNAAISAGMKGSEERDVLFARLFGYTAIIDSGILYRESSSAQDWPNVVYGLMELGPKKAWLRESAWWAIVNAVKGLMASQAEWKVEALEDLIVKLQEEKLWTQEKLAVTLLLEQKGHDVKALLQPTFKHTPLLAGGNLSIIARILKETDAEDDESGAATSSTGSWKPQIHFIWDMILDNHFSSTSTTGQAPFQTFFHAVVDESLFANNSSPQRRFWGFEVFQKALPLTDSSLMPQLFTPNFMRCWMNNLSSSDRYLHKAAQNTARLVQDIVKANPRVGFALLSRLVGKHGRPDFDKVTKTKTVEGIMGSLSVEGVAEYVQYLQGVILGVEEQNGIDIKAIDDRRIWAIDQLHGLCRNGSVPKDDAWISSVLDFLLVHGFFVIRKPSKKSNISALHTAPKPALSETAATACRSRFFGCLVELTTASPPRSASISESATQPARLQGCDASGTLWLRRALSNMISLENDKHVEQMLDADDEIKKERRSAISTLEGLPKNPEQAEVSRGIEILLSFVLLQTYDENDDSLEMLDDVNNSAALVFKDPEEYQDPLSEAPLPIDVLLDTLIALLDKGSSDLRSLGVLVFGMVSPAFTSTSIEHLVAQLTQTVAEAAAGAGEGDDAEEDEESGESSSIADDDEEAEDDDEDDEDEQASDDNEDDIEEEEDMAPVDPEFRQRVADALKLAGMGVDEEAKEDGESDEDSEVWDDEQMMKVDEQLAAVFRQQASRTKKSDLKHLQIESVHFKTRILDLFDTYARKQSTNPLVLDLIIPLLNLVRGSSSSETDLSSKASGILRSRLAKAKDIPALEDFIRPSDILKSIHEMARKATSADFSSLCSGCSIFVARSIDGSHPTSPIVVDTYRSTLQDFLSRKSSLVHPAFVLDFIKRFPLRAWPLREDLCQNLLPGKGVNAYRTVQGFSMLQALVNQLPAISKASGIEVAEVAGFVSQSANVIYETLKAAAAGDAEWKADRLKEVVKFALALARTSKTVLGEAGAQKAWDVSKLKAAQDVFGAGEKTSSMKGIASMLVQVVGILGATKKEEKSKNKSKKDKTPASDAMDVDEAIVDLSGVTGETEKGKKRKLVNGDKASKKAKSGEKTKKSKTTTAL